MLQSVCVPVALMSCLVLLWPIDIQACPRSCNCYQTSEVHCTFRSLLTIPPGLPLHTQRINFGYNSITTIHNRSLAGLKKLELLMLHSNNLHYLPDAVFADLKSLQILKLSYNKLLEIPSSLTFSGLTSLLRLYLDHNLLQHIHPRALLQLPSLRLLRLQGNRLHQLHPHALCTLSLLNTYYFSTLRHLDLSNNSLTTLPRNSLATAPLLETLQLQDNPWSCDCRMNWLLTWILAHPEFSMASPAPLPLAVSLMLDCPVHRQGYEKLWRILAYYSETAVRLEREIMLSKAPSLAYRYRQTAETDGYYHSGVRASVKVPVLRSRPKIAEPHVRTVSFPAESTARLVCESEGEPKPFITWTKVATGAMMSIHSKAQRFEVLSNGTLVIHAVQLQDRGTYICSAHSFLGRDRSITTLDVWTRPPRMLVPSYRETTIHQVMLLPREEHLLLSPGMPVYAHCSARGTPPPIVIWRTPSKKLVDMHFSFDRRLKVHSNGTLSVQAVTEKDAGDYLCITRNKVADDYRLLRVSVTTKPAKIERRQPLNHMVSLGKTLKAQGQGGRAQKLTVFDNGTLLVPAIGAREEGEYTCYAQNQGGQDTMKVKVKVMMATPPTFSDDKNFNIVKVPQGNTAVIQCQAKGDPIPIITWFSPAHVAIPHRSRLYRERIAVLLDGSLEVHQARELDTGNYTCRASNSAGETNMVVGLRVETSNHGLSDQKTPHHHAWPGFYPVMVSYLLPTMAADLQFTEMAHWSYAMSGRKSGLHKVEREEEHMVQKVLVYLSLLSPPQEQCRYTLHHSI
ncbi:Matrix-remodeling-associated protein 5 [Takifugu flavidus]|uniref:Matrix-remodeling-associated protein 5 n=1 Tax=Takifugu flavidus TaxID=433684 RepID=A0A5C6PQS7_9TELE|nr:Matrix-remodeling-associated protein 5 [Takifugu flavidus]